MYLSTAQGGAGRPPDSRLDAGATATLKEE